MRTRRGNSREGVTSLSSSHSLRHTHNNTFSPRNPPAASPLAYLHGLFSLATPRPSRHTTKRKQGQSNYSSKDPKKPINKDQGELMYQKGEMYDNLRSTVAKLLDFYKYTVLLWLKRVSSLDIRMLQLPVADESFLERIAKKLSAYLHEVMNTLQLLNDSMQTAGVNTRWNKYAQGAHESLFQIKKLICALQSRIAKILSFALSTSPETLSRVMSYMDTAVTPPLPPPTSTSTPTPTTTTTTRATMTRLSKGISSKDLYSHGITDYKPTGFRSNTSLATRLSSYGSSSTGLRSDGSINDLRVAPSGPKHATPLRARQVHQRSILSLMRNSSCSASPRTSQSREPHHGYHNHHNNQHLGRRQQQRQSSGGSHVDPHYSWANTSTHHFTQPSIRAGFPSQSTLLRKEPFYEHVSGTLPAEFFPNEPIHDDRDSGIKYNRRGNGDWDFKTMVDEFREGVLSHSRSRNRSEGQIHPDERRMLLERIDTIGKSFAAQNAASLNEAEQLFNRLYGFQRGPRYFSEWLDDIEMREIRHR